MLEKATFSNLLKKISNWFTKDRKTIFLVTLIAGLLIHFELYSNELLAYDGYWHYGSFLAKGWEISLGRFFIPLIDILRGTVVVSFLSTFLSLVILSFTTVILCDLLKIRKTYFRVFIALLLVSIPSFSLTLMYPYTADSYTFALLFAVLTVYFLNKPKNAKNIILTLIFLVITLGFYQAYLGVVFALFLITYIVKLFTENKIDCKSFFKEFFIDILTLILGIIIYYICFTLIVKLLHLNITDYSDGSKVLSLETIKNIIPSIKNSYISFYEFYFRDNIVANPNYLGKKIINLLAFILVFINFIILVLNNKTYKNSWKIVFLIFAIALYPLFTCIIEVIAQSRKIDLLMSTSLYFVFVLLIKQADLIKISKLNNIINLFSIVVIIGTIWTFILSDNATYVAANMYNKQMYAVGNRIITELSHNDEIKSDTPICITGKLDFNVHNPHLLELTNFDVTDVNIWTWQIFLEDNLALGRNIYTADSYSEIFDLDEYNAMGVFPDKSSIKIVNGTAVVKLNY